MTFGGAPCLSLWGYISDSIADLCNALLQDESWNHTDLHDSISDLLPNPAPISPSIPFKQARDLFVSNHIIDERKTGIYIDDFITVTPILATILHGIMLFCP
jgi:hypothetical protein